MEKVGPKGEPRMIFCCSPTIFASPDRREDRSQIVSAAARGKDLTIHSYLYGRLSHGSRRTQEIGYRGAMTVKYLIVFVRVFRVETSSLNVAHKKEGPSDKEYR